MMDDDDNDDSKDNDMILFGLPNLANEHLV